MSEQANGHPPPAAPRRRQSGLSLIELLIAMAMGLFLIAGMVAVFSGNKRSTQLNTAVSTMQENARYALDRMAEDLRMAGFQGCSSLAGGSVRVAATSVPMNDPARGLLDTAVFGSRVSAANAWTPPPPYGPDFSVPAAVPGIPGTHALSLQFGSPQTGRMDRPVGIDSPSKSGDVRLLDGADLERDLATGNLAIISDCIGGELFRITQSSLDAQGRLTVRHGAGANRSGAFDAIYGENGTLGEVRVMSLNTHLYFVGDTGLKNQQGDTIRALYKQTLPFGDPDNPPSELVQGVENLRLSFGIRGAGRSLRYVPPGHVDFRVENVRAVRVGILMSSYEHIADEDDRTVYMLAGQPIGPAGDAQTQPGDAHPGDRRFRLAFNTTVKVRNFREDGSR